MDTAETPVPNGDANGLAGVVAHRSPVAMPRIGVRETEGTKTLRLDRAGDLLGSGQCGHHQVEACVQIVGVNR